MQANETSTAGKPLARYASWKRVGDMVYMSGVIAVEPSSGRVVESFEDMTPVSYTHLTLPTILLV